MKLFKIYNKVKDVFVKPKVSLYFGKWSKDPNLPIWRHGIQIDLFKSSQYDWHPIATIRSKKIVYQVENSVLFISGTKMHKRIDGTERPVTEFGRSFHKLPCKYNTLVWRSDIRRKLRKYHLGWIKPRMTLPIFTAFYIFDRPLGWKTKWDEYRYEYPPQFTIVFFGLSLTITLHSPNGYDDDYWESILNYIECKDIAKTSEIMGTVTKMHSGICRYTFTPEMLKEPYKTQLQEIQNENNRRKSR